MPLGSVERVVRASMFRGLASKASPVASSSPPLYVLKTGARSTSPGISARSGAGVGTYSPTVRFDCLTYLAATRCTSAGLTAFTRSR